MKQGFVYIMASATRTIYTGVTNDLGRRVWEHKHGLGGEFTKRYTVTKLVWCEEFGRMDDAIASEKALKGKTRPARRSFIRRGGPRSIRRHCMRREGCPPAPVTHSPPVARHVRPSCATHSMLSAVARSRDASDAPGSVVPTPPARSFAGPRLRSPNPMLQCQ